MTVVSFDFSGCLSYGCQTSTADAPANETQESNVDCETVAGEKPENAINGEESLPRDLDTRSLRLSNNQLTNAQIERSQINSTCGETECKVERCIVKERPMLLNVDSTHVPEIPRKASHSSLQVNTTSRIQLSNPGQAPQHEEVAGFSVAGLPLESQPKSALSVSTVSPRTACLSPVSSEESASSIANQAMADSPPASLLRAFADDSGFQALTAVTQLCQSLELHRPARSKAPRSSSDGFSTFASRSEVDRAMAPFGRKFSRTPRSSFDDEPHPPAIDGISVERFDESRIRDVLDNNSLTKERPRWRRLCSVPRILRKKAICTCAEEYPKRCRLHKKLPHQNPTAPRLCESPDEDRPGQRSGSLYLLPEFDFGAELTRQLVQGLHVHLVDESADEDSVAQPLGSEEGVPAQAQRIEDVVSEIPALNLSIGSWHYVSNQLPQLNPPRRHTIDSHMVDESEHEIGIARPLGPEDGVLASIRKSEECYIRDVRTKPLEQLALRPPPPR